jgi:hypothetical protein
LILNIRYINPPNIKPKPNNNAKVFKVGPIATVQAKPFRTNPITIIKIERKILFCFCILFIFFIRFRSALPITFRRFSSVANFGTFYFLLKIKILAKRERELTTKFAIARNGCWQIVSFFNFLIFRIVVFQRNTKQLLFYLFCKDKIIHIRHRGYYILIHCFFH